MDLLPRRKTVVHQSPSPPVACVHGAWQDYPKSLGSEAKVGFTSVDPWLCFSPCKNNTADAAKAQVSLPLLRLFDGKCFPVTAATVAAVAAKTRQRCAVSDASKA